MMPSPADLNYFCEVAGSLNVSRASERLGISQPSLTLAMQRLEHAIGAPLLLRSKKGVALTQAGKQLLAHTKELMQKWDSIKSHALASANEVKGSYTIGCHVSVSLYSLPAFVAELMDKNPSLEIKLVHDLSRKIAERVVQMEVDVGLVVNPMRHPDLVIRKLCNDEVTLWVGKGSRKSQNLRGGVLICDPELLQTQAILKKLKKTGIQYQRVIASSSLEVITALVSSGAGIGILPGRVASTVQGLRRIPEAPTFSDEICMIYRVENKAVKSIEVITGSIAAAFR